MLRTLNDLEGGAGLETAITRTPLATALILANLSGQTGVTVPCLASSMVSLYVRLPSAEFSLDPGQEMHAHVL